MSSRAYHRIVRPDEAGRRHESTDGPWLDEKTTAPYVPWSVKLRTGGVETAAQSVADTHTHESARRVRSARHTPQLKAAPPGPSLRMPSVPTPAQLSSVALENFWRDTQRRELRARRLRLATLALSAVLLCLLCLVVFGQELLPSALRTPQLNARFAQTVKLVQQLVR